MTHIIENFNISDKRDGMLVSGHDHVIIRNGTFTNCLKSLRVFGNGYVEIHDIDIFVGPRQDDERYGSGILLGGSSSDTSKANDLVEIKNVFVENMGAPLTSYAIDNNDCIAVEHHQGLVKVTDCNLGGAHDANMDCKSPVQLFNSQLGPAHRQLRAWNASSGIKEYGNTFSPNPGHSQYWEQTAGLIDSTAGDWLLDPFFGDAGFDATPLGQLFAGLPGTQAELKTDVQARVLAAFAMEQELAKKNADFNTIVALATTNAVEVPLNMSDFLSSFDTTPLGQVVSKLSDPIVVFRDVVKQKAYDNFIAGSPKTDGEILMEALEELANL